MAKTTKLPPKLVKYLEDAGINHNVLEHRTVYTALDAAATMKKKMDEVVKSLVIAADKDYYLVLLPADCNVDFDKLKKLLSQANSKEIKIIKIPGEEIMEDALKIKAATLTAFGKMHNLGVVLDKKLENIKKAIFSSGSTNHSIEMAVKDFIKLEKPILGNFTIKRKIKKQAVTKPKRTGKKKSVTKKAVSKKVVLKKVKKVIPKKKVVVKKKGRK
jgi:prolyl-tRNA editing enzyme YbaK/EbsC (Cys-tRNA(Pro) deacylase)